MKQIPSINFQRTYWDDFALYFNSHCPSAQEYSSCLSASALFTSLALTELNLPFLLTASNANPKHGRLLNNKKPKKKHIRLLLLLIEPMNTNSLTSLALDMPCLSPPKPRLRHGRWHASLSLLNQPILFFILTLALLLPLLTFPTVLLPETQAWSMLTTRDSKAQPLPSHKSFFCRAAL